MFLWDRPQEARFTQPLGHKYAQYKEEREREGGVINDGAAAAAVFNAPFSALHTPNNQPSDCLAADRPGATLRKKVMIMMPELFNMQKPRCRISPKGCDLG